MHGRHRVKEPRVVGHSERVNWQQDVTHILHQDGVAGAIIRTRHDSRNDWWTVPPLELAAARHRLAA